MQRKLITLLLVLFLPIVIFSAPTTSYCNADDECATQYCYQHRGWDQGICVDKSNPPTMCSYDSDCPDKYCFKKTGWTEGYCALRE